MSLTAPWARYMALVQRAAGGPRDGDEVLNGNKWGPESDVHVKERHLKSQAMDVSYKKSLRM